MYKEGKESWKCSMKRGLTLFLKRKTGLEIFYKKDFILFLEERRARNILLKKMDCFFLRKRRLEKSYKISSNLVVSA